MELVGGWSDAFSPRTVLWSVAVVKPGTYRCDFNVGITGLFHVGRHGQWSWASGFISSSECSSCPVFLFPTVWVRGRLLWHRKTFMSMHCLDFLFVAWPLSMTLLNCCSKLHFSADIVVHTHRFLFGLYIDFHLFVQLKPNHDFNLTCSHEHFLSDIYWEMCVCHLKRLNTSCPWLPLVNTDDAYILIFPAI